MSVDVPIKSVKSTVTTRCILPVGMVLFYSHVMELSFILYMELIIQTGYYLTKNNNSVLYEWETARGKGLVDEIVRNQSYVSN